MTPEQRTRALRHYSAGAAVALRIEQLEAQNAMLVKALQGLLHEDGGSLSFAASNPRCIAARAALANVEAARTGASHA